ncbi:MAG TPA: hypothetical protein PK441_13620 [Burkholderiaceae bacterium]|nr:MAG: hypothetical protein BWZ08_02664 [candidate division BRC1 bacterium ADurb.BinA292]HOF31884.1 hypothetical protein [Burkholderiaceae bacterium]
MAQRRGRDLEKEALWRGRLAEQAASGCSICAWCHQNGIQDALFHYWKRTIARRDSSPGASDSAAPSAAGDRALFARVVLTPPPAPTLAQSRPGDGCLELIVAGGHVVRVPAGFDAPTLARVLDVLAARPC